MSFEVTTLIDMGFTKEQAEKGLQMTSGGVEQALEWILAHGNDDEPSSSATSRSNEENPVPTLSLNSDSIDNHSNSSEKPSEDSLAKSIKCDDEDMEVVSSTIDQNSKGLDNISASASSERCGKLFRTQLEVEFHAGKSGHSAFSESTEEKKPLSEEEKKEQLRKVEEMLKQKRKEREEKEKKDELEREKMRIKSGKEMVAAKKKLEDDEIRKMAEQRRREKEEEKLARERVRQQIEADKLARKMKYAPESQPAVASSPAPAVVSSTPSVKKTYSETKLQIRLTNGNTLTQTFGCKEQLSAVRLFIEINRTDGEGPFALLTSFPKKKFSDDDYNKPLEVLGLVPSAVLIVTKAI